MRRQSPPSNHSCSVTESGRTVSEEIYIEMQCLQEAKRHAVKKQVLSLLLLQECCDLLDQIEIDFLLPHEPLLMEGAAQNAAPLRVTLLHQGHVEMQPGELTFRHSV